MNCHLWRNELMELARIELARGRPSEAVDRAQVAAHVNGCRSCRLFMEEQLGLTAAFEEFAARTEMALPANLESMVLSEFEAHRPIRRRHLKVAAAGIAAIAAALVWLAAIPRAHLTPPARVETVAEIPPVVRRPDIPVQKPVSKRVRRHVANPADDADPFVAIPYTVPIDPRERAVVMRMEMPVTALAAVGLTVAASDPSASAQTDVIVGEDGRIRAIRLLSISNSNFDRSVNP